VETAIALKELTRHVYSPSEDSTNSYTYLLLNVCLVLILFSFVNMSMYPQQFQVFHVLRRTSTESVVIFRSLSCLHQLLSQYSLSSSLTKLAKHHALAQRVGH
jgi:hypothetical protein